jgi:cell wall-associated NlpC family hydrolase
MLLSITATFRTIYRTIAIIVCFTTLSTTLSAESLPNDPLGQLLQDKGLITELTSTESGKVFSQVPLYFSASDMVISAMNFLDVRYRLGGNNPQEGFDCSGFTRHMFQSSRGLNLPRRADEQARAAWLSQVPREALQPGDLVFFNTLKRTFSHVGIYVGDGKFIHAPRTGAFVRIENMHFAYWAKRFTGARRPAMDVALASQTPTAATRTADQAWRTTRDSAASQNPTLTLRKISANSNANSLNADLYQH